MIDQEKRILAAIKAGCSAADYHLACSYPDCRCKNTPVAIKAALAAADAVTAETHVARETPDEIATRILLGIPMLVDQAESMANDILAGVARARESGHDHIAPFRFSAPPVIISRLAAAIKSDRGQPVESQDRAAS